MIDFKLKPNSRILKFNAKLSNQKTSHYSTVRFVSIKSIDESQANEIKTLESIFISLNVHVLAFTMANG